MHNLIAHGLKVLKAVSQDKSFCLDAFTTKRSDTGRSAVLNDSWVCQSYLLMHSRFTLHKHCNAYISTFMAAWPIATHSS